jgi:hypothetical protein
VPSIAGRVGDLLRSLGPPDVCYVADGVWQDPGKNALCTKSGAPSWRFFHLPQGWMGGGAHFLCRLDAHNRCASPFLAWHKVAM